MGHNVRVKSGELQFRAANGMWWNDRAMMLHNPEEYKACVERMA